MKHYWTVVVTKWKQELRAAANVERLGYEYYLPIMVDERTRRALMFPGYLMVRVREGWEVLSSARGVSRLMLCSDVPSRIADEEVEQLRRLEDERGLVRLAPRFAVGQFVRGRCGQYEGLSGIVQGTSASGRCAVLLRMLGKHVVVDIEGSALVAA